jgi:hypothetical protein
MLPLHSSGSCSHELMLGKLKESRLNHQLTSRDGYIVNFVNTSNEQQVFATTPSFTIEQGESMSISTSFSTMLINSAKYDFSIIFDV